MHVSWKPRDESAMPTWTAPTPRSRSCLLLPSSACSSNNRSVCLAASALAAVIAAVSRSLRAVTAVSRNISCKRSLTVDPRFRLHVGSMPCMRSADPYQQQYGLELVCARLEKQR